MSRRSQISKVTGGMEVSVVLKNVALTAGEGPHWDHTAQCLYYVDDFSGDVHRWDSVTGKDTKVHAGGTVGFVVPRRSGGLVIGQKLGFSHLDWDTGMTRVLAEDKQSKAFFINDGKCDVTGRVWGGTVQPIQNVFQDAPTHIAALYSLETDGRLVKRLGGISLSNGLTWSLDNSVMYYIDSIPGTLYTFSFDPSTGDIANQRVLRDCSDGSLALPDGMTVDQEGKLWIACYGGGKIARLDPETGKTIQEIPIPNAKRVTSCCFGGPDFSELFVTSGRMGVTEEEFRTSEPLAGSLFKIRGLGVKGQPMFVYEG